MHFYERWECSFDDSLCIYTLHCAAEGRADLQEEVRGAVDVGTLIVAGGVEEGRGEENCVALRER